MLVRVTHGSRYIVGLREFRDDGGYMVSGEATSIETNAFIYPNDRLLWSDRSMAGCTVERLE